MTAPICQVEDFDLASGEIATTQEIRIAKEYHYSMSSPGMAPDPDQRYVMVPYSEIAQGLARSRMSPWIPISMVMTWVVLGVVAVFILKSRNDERMLQSAMQSQNQTILKLASSIGDQGAQIFTLTNSVQNLTGAVSSLSTTIRQTEARVNRSAREVRRVEARLRAAETRLNAQPKQP